MSAYTAICRVSDEGGTKRYDYCSFFLSFEQAKTGRTYTHREKPGDNKQESELQRSPDELRFGKKDGTETTKGGKKKEKEGRGVGAKKR